MLLDEDVVADREAEAGALSRRFGREERVEHLLFHQRVVVYVYNIFDFRWKLLEFEASGRYPHCVKGGHAC